MDLYTAYDERTPDTQYRRVLQDILDHGVRVPSQQGVDALTLIAPQAMRFRMNNGFPLITERSMNPAPNENLPVTVWQQAVGEIIAFINGAVTIEELKEFGCFWWDKWGTEEKCAKRGLPTGNIGHHSYGGAFHDFPDGQGGTFNQFDFLVRQIREQPQLRTHFVSPWFPPDIFRVKGHQQKLVVAPCHGWVHIRIIENKMILHMFQRSANVPVGVPANMVMYGALLLMLAKVTGYEPYEYVHSFSDAHIYTDQLDQVGKMLAREPRRLPTITLTRDTNDLFAFRREDFVLTDYEPHPGMKMPVAV